MQCESAKSVYISGLGGESTKPSSGPEGRLLLDLSHQCSNRGAGSVEDTVILVFPKHPGYEQGRGGEALAHGLERELPRREPPEVDRLLAVGRVAGYPQPAQYLVPYLPREWAGEEEMLDGLRRLVAKRAARGVLQAAAGEAVSGPTPIEMGEPMEESDARRCPALPSELPGIAGGGSVERG